MKRREDVKAGLPALGPGSFWRRFERSNSLQSAAQQFHADAQKTGLAYALEENRRHWDATVFEEQQICSLLLDLACGAVEFDAERLASIAAT